MTGKKPRPNRTAIAVTTAAETARVAQLLARDGRDRRADRLREAALAEMAKGRFANQDDAKLGPTPEHAAKVPFEPFTADKVPGTARSVQTVRRVSVNRVKQLYDRGVFSDDTYPAVLWYQRQFEAAGFVLGASAANWGEAIVGERSYGAMPKSATAAEARELFRFARGGRRQDSDGEITFEAWSLPADMLPTFDLVVLDEMTIQEAATAAKCRYTNAAAAVKHVALLLAGRIAHLLPVRAVGAPGSEPVEQLLEPVPVGVPAGGFGELDPIFRNEHGILRSWDVIAGIVRMRVAGVPDDEILAGLGEDQ
jgi:hypothetical protein